jgi:hypothetical protein
VSEEKPNIVIIDSATKLGNNCRGKVLVCGSHGGEYPAWLVAKAGCLAAILNDAGIGKDEAGIASLNCLETPGIAVACIDTMSARIGDAQDMFERGIISCTNKPAQALGVKIGQSCKDAAALMAHAELTTFEPGSYDEARVLLPGENGQADVVLIDSASLVKPEDAGRIIITGSHGGLVGGKPEMALQVDGLAGIYHDAGGGADGAGLTRLSALDQRKIAAATVSANSARIGDARSIFEDGVISHVNKTAGLAGGKAGQSVKKFVALLRKNAH